jgi:hypothetical protein
VVRERIEGPSSFFTSKLAPQKTRTKLLVIGVILLSAGIILSILLPILTSVDSSELDTWAYDNNRESGDTINVRGKINKGNSSFGTALYKFTNADETFTGEWNMANEGETVILTIKYEDWSTTEKKPILSVVRLDTVISVYSLPPLMAIVGLIFIIPPLIYNISVVLGAKKGTIKERHTIIPEEGQKQIPTQFQQPPQSPLPTYPSQPPSFVNPPHQQMPPQSQQYYAAPPMQPRQPPRTSSQPQLQEPEGHSEDIFLLDPKEREDLLEELKTQEKQKKSKANRPF